MSDSIFAASLSRLGTETAFDVLAKARALEARGKNIIHLEIGEPDFDTPAFIKEAAIKALWDGYTHYGPAQGLPVLREAAAAYLTRSRKVQFEPDELVITPGAKPILFFSIMALVDPGDEVIYPNPGFPIYESMINYVGGIPVPLQLREENQFRVDVAELRCKVTGRTKLIILNSPQNPTGSVLTKADVEGIADVVQDRDIMVLSDEVYCQILYEGKFESLASLPGMKEKVILLDGFSKTYAMTGWRLGYAAARKDLIAIISKLMTNSVSCTASFIQVAGAAALNGPQDSVGVMVSEFERRRNLIVDGLNSLPGVTCSRPAGAFYVFPSIVGTGMSSQEIADLMLYEGNVALLSGTCFGAYGEGYLRLSYANSQENIREALARMRATLEKNAKR